MALPLHLDDSRVFGVVPTCTLYQTLFDNEGNDDADDDYEYDGDDNDGDDGSDGEGGDRCLPC